MNCGSCKFYKLDDGPFEIGQCRRYAPRPALVSSTQEDEERPDHPRFPVWPVMLPDEFCGEFVSRKERQVFV